MPRKELKAHLSAEIEALIKQSSASWEKQNYADSITFLSEAWEKLPEPKGDYSENFHRSKP